MMGLWEKVVFRCSPSFMEQNWALSFKSGEFPDIIMPSVMEEVLF